MARSWHILGALGSGPFAPLLAEQRWRGGRRRVVLGRPALDTADALGDCASPWVVAERDRIVLYGKAFGVFDFAPGQSVAALLDGHSDGLPVAALVDLMAQVLAILGEAGVVHGALGPGTIVVDPRGRIRLLGFTGRDGDDRGDLRALAEDWGTLPESALDAIERGDLEALRQASVGGESLAGLVSEGLPPIQGHPWSGEALTEADATPPVPPKARTAAIAALTLALGLATGWFLRG